MLLWAVRTVVIQALATLGLTVTGVSGDVYTSAVGSTAVTVFVQKIWDGLTKKKANILNEIRMS